MSLNKNKHAFTLAEVMIVLLVLTLLLAVFAPMITKRRSKGKQEDLWRWATRNYLAGPMDAYYDIDNGIDASLFIGITPDSRVEIDDLYQPLGKIIIRGGYIDDDHIQHQIHFRHGRENFEDIGNFTGTLLADGSNLLLGGKYENMKPKQTDDTYPVNNIAIGFVALDKIGDYGVEEGVVSGTDRNNIAIGHKSAHELAKGQDNVIVGSGAGELAVNAFRNTFIGAGAGHKTYASDNTLIGYKSTSGSGIHNAFIGAESGQQIVYTEATPSDYSYNTAIGYRALSSITGGSFNVAIGSGALRRLNRGFYNVAIGYNACANLINESYKTCIGYNSGPAEDSGAKAELGMGIDDNAQRTYIGANPHISADGTWNVKNLPYGGDAVLEIHNVGGHNAGLINDPSINSNTTTIVNGNLAVMGRTYLTVGNYLFPFSYENNILGAEYNQPCSNTQDTYSFANGGNCADLSGLSDRRLKDIGSKYSAGLNEINKIKVYDYNYKDDKDKKKHTGVIAQELQKIFPNSVFEDDNGYLKIRWDEMFYAGINAIKELNNKISSMIKQVTNIEAQIQKLEKENKELRDKINKLSKRVEKLKNR